MIASLSAFNDTNPRRNKIHRHMSSIFPGRNATKRTKNDKVVDDTSNEETMKSTCRQVKKEDKQIPHSTK